jgi:Flp pilus assembly protein TadG
MMSDDTMTVESDVAKPSHVTRLVWSRIQNDESGIALVWMSLFLMVLLGFAALAVDIGHGYLVAQREQNAADAAALAGTIYLPADLNAAQTAATSVASANGFTNGSNGVTVSAVQFTQVSQLKVTITQDVPTWFGRAIGFKSMHVVRSAVADYRPPVEMGSPTSQFGNDPESAGAAGSSTYPNLWGNIAGPEANKQNGDAYQAGGCANAADGCSQAPTNVSCGYAGTNVDYDCKGYYYDVHVPSGGAAIKLQAFDPGFVAVGDDCGTNDDGSNLGGAAGLTIATVAGWPSGVTTDAPLTRYAGTRYCTGDSSFGFGGASDDPNIITTYTVLGPATVPGDVNSAPTTPICTKSYPGFEGDLKAKLGDFTTGAKMNVYANGVSSPEFLGQYFRQWDNLCPSSISTVAGDYFIEMRTNLTLNGQPYTQGFGHNRFALRAVGGSNIGIFGDGKMGIYANVGGGNLTQFYLARLLPNDAGHTLVLSLFDIGDGSSSGSLTIVPPPDAKEGAGAVSLDGCTMQLGTATAFTPVNGTTSPCMVTGVQSSAGYQGKWLTIDVPIPANYTCDTSSPTNCWFRINYLFTGGIEDTTSWTASLGGDPVRIVK